MTTNLQLAKDDIALFNELYDSGHTDYLARSEAAKRYYASRQWKDADVSKRTTEGRLAFTVNEIFRTINAVAGELAQISSDVRYDPVSGDEETARTLNKLAEYIDRQNKTYLHDQTVRLHGLLTGRGFFEQRATFDENMQGHIRRRAFRPENVILDLSNTSMDPADWERVFTTEVVSENDVELLYGRAAAEEIRQRGFPDWLRAEDRNLAQKLTGAGTAAPDIHSTSTKHRKQYRLVNHQFRSYEMRDFFVDLATGDMSEIPESWPREKVQAALETFGLGTRRQKARTLRWRVVCNDTVLHDEYSPYKHFTIVPFLPFFLDGATLSLFDVLQGPQDLLNYVVSEEAHILGTTSHSGWKVKDGSLKNMTPRQLEEKGAKNGLVLLLEETADAERITPGQPAAGFERMGDRSRSWIQELANVTPSMMGNQRADASGGGIKTQLSRAPVNLTAPLTAFHFTKQLLAEHTLDLIQAYYTETRIMRIAPTPYAETEEIVINQPTSAGKIANDVTVGRYTVRLLPVGSRMQADEYAFDELLQMRELGIQVPNSLFIATSSLQAKASVIEQLIAANSGDLSPEEQRMRQIEIEKAEAELMDALEGVEAKRAQKILSLARAQRAQADAQYDARRDSNEINRTRMVLEHQRAMRQMDEGVRKDDKNVAVKLTEIQAKAKKDEAAPKTAPKKKTPSKTAAT